MENKEYFNSLTGLRAVAAILVYFHHYPISGLVFGGLDIQREMHIGVSLFFVLSGFLISNRYYRSIDSLGEFFKYIFRRFARIYPVYFFLFFLIFVIKIRTTNVEYLFTNVFLTKGFYDDLKFNGIAQSWSLTVEFCFYIIAPLLFIFGKRFGIRTLLIVGFLVSITMNFYAINSLSFKESRFLLIYTFLGRIFEFIIGIFLGVFVVNYKGECNKMQYNTLVGIIGVILILLALTIIKYKFSYLDFGLYHSFGIFLNNILLPIFVVFLLKGLIFEVTFLSRILATPLFQFLGKSSYVFYLIHMGIFNNFLKKIIPVSNSLSVSINFIILWIIAYFIYSFVEEPVNKFLCKYA